MAKYIFVTGGVVSSLGKGIAAASIGCLLESRGLKVTCQKFDPYLNVDPGTLSPFQHGEVFVTDDGAETDLDLGHYERFTHSKLTQSNNLTSGRIYEQIIARERRGDYLGKTVQVIPHVTNEIKAALKKVSGDVDVVIAEIGGTVGDIESLPFLEAIRQMRHEEGRDNCLFIHVTLVPWIAAAQELKTKPTQHSVKELRALGIQPDILLCRCERFIPQEMKEKIALFCDVDVRAVITARDVKSVYAVPVGFAAEGVDEIVMRLLKLDCGPRDMAKWTAMLERLDNPRGEVTIGLVVYVGSTDSAIFNAMATASPLNAQLSSSWTWSPADPNTDKPYFQEFAAQGQNLFQASGDSAAWKSSSRIYPADDVYLTSVGGTDLVTSSAGGPWSSETAWANGGRGISPDKFAMPSWQTATASGCSKCSKTYRNAPDVSANANYTFYVCADQTTCTANDYGGTSFAAPMWAGYLALANQQSLANGGTALGFINPTLYTIGLGSSYTSDFHDITGGSNGYAATTGYDLATGWGSPNGAALINALLGTPVTPGFSLSASPASVSVAQGSSGTSTITSTVTGGFDSAVSLTATGQPTGVTVGFSPTSITGDGTSTLTMTVASSTVAGTYSITVTGTSGSA